jgi:hypothetical protein
MNVRDGLASSFSSIRSFVPRLPTKRINLLAPSSSFIQQRKRKRACGVVGHGGDRAERGHADRAPRIRLHPHAHVHKLHQQGRTTGFTNYSKIMMRFLLAFN